MMQSGNAKRLCISRLAALPHAFCLRGDTIKAMVLEADHSDVGYLDDFGDTDRKHRALSEDLPVVNPKGPSTNLVRTLDFYIGNLLVWLGPSIYSLFKYLDPLAKVMILLIVSLNFRPGHKAGICESLQGIRAVWADSLPCTSPGPKSSP